MKIEYISKEITTEKIRKEVMNGDQMKILPSEIWLKYDWTEIRKLMHETGTYVLPTEELIDHLDKLIGQEEAIEVAAGNGWIGRELNIPVTDKKMQETEFMKKYYESLGQPVIKYPEDVEKYDALDAVRHYRPHTVLVCYCPHKSKTGSGCDHGINFSKMLNMCRRIIFVCNTGIHYENPIFKFKHQNYTIPGLITRSGINSESNRICIWSR